MANTIQEERRWVVPIIHQEIRLVDAVKVCPYGRRTLERWVAVYKRAGPAALVPHSTAPKTYRVETTIHTKEQIIELRKQTNLCALKLKWKLAKQGVNIHERTIGKIIKAEGLVRQYRVKKIKYQYIKARRQPGELVEIDVKYVPGTIAGRAYFQYTAIDTASRWRHLAVYDEQSTASTLRFLQEVMARFPYRIRAIKTDNHSTFTNYYLGTNKRSDQTVKTLHALDQFCAQHSIVHYLIDPGKPAQNGTVERSHREDEEKFYQRNQFDTYADLQKKLNEWNIYYNNLEHCGLQGKTPQETLAEYQLIHPPDVCT